MLWLIAGFIIFFILVLLSRVYINLTFKYQQDEPIMQLSIRLYGIRLFKRQINLSEVESSNSLIENFKGKTFAESIDQLQIMLKRLKNTISDLKMGLKVFLKRLRVHQLKWETLFGTGEASSTGTVTGGIWTAKGTCVGLFASMSQLKCKPKLNVIPHFQRKIIETEFDCIVSIRIGQAIHALFKVLRKSSLKKEAVI